MLITRRSQVAPESNFDKLVRFGKWAKRRLERALKCYYDQIVEYLLFAVDW